MALHRCPAFEGGPNWKQLDIFDVPCPDCGTETRVFSFTGKHRELLRGEKPACGCGSPGGRSSESGG